MTLLIPQQVRLSAEVAGQRYPISRVIPHPTFDRAWTSEDEDDEHESVDLALLELEAPVPDVRPVDLYDRQDEQEQEALLLGRGEFGNGRREVRGFDRALRLVTNQIEGVNRYWLKMRFDEPPTGTRLEGVCGNGDSGGPAFIHHDDRFLLAGVSSWTKLGGRPFGTYGCIEQYTRVSCFIEWIRSTAGLPS